MDVTGTHSSCVCCAPGLMEAVMQGGKESLSWGRGSIRSSFVIVPRGWLGRLWRILSAPGARSRGSPMSWASIPRPCARGWRTAQVDAGQRPGTTTADAQRIKDLEREVRELRRANEILRKASAYFAQAEPGPPVADLVGFIEDNKGLGARADLPGPERLGPPGSPRPPSTPPEAGRPVPGLSGTRPSRPRSPGSTRPITGSSGPARSTSCSTVPSELPSTVWGISPGAPPSG